MGCLSTIIGGWLVLQESRAKNKIEYGWRCRVGSFFIFECDLWIYHANLLHWATTSDVKCNFVRAVDKVWVSKQQHEIDGFAKMYLLGLAK